MIHPTTPSLHLPPQDDSICQATLAQALARELGDEWLIGVGVIFVTIGLVFYFAFPLIRRRPSPGACITGCQVVPDDGTTMTLRTAVFRTLLGFIALCAAYLAPFIERDSKNGKFWLDKVFDTRAVTLQ